VKIKILDEAQDDLIQGFRLYEGREAGLGAYFLDCLFSDIDSLLLYGESIKSYMVIAVASPSASRSPFTTA
jgi:hypothetical protein